MFQKVPTIDLSQEETIVAKNIVEACSNVGFFYVANHGVPAEQISKVCSQSASFFKELPINDKAKLSTNRFCPQNKNTYRGYFPTQENSTSYKEGFEMGGVNDDDDDNDMSLLSGSFTPSSEEEYPFYEPNVWPESSKLPEFRPTMKKYFAVMQILGSKIMRYIAIGFGLPGHYFDHSFENSISTLRLLHYPENNLSTCTLSCSEHCDSGVLTLLYQDQVGGLQVQNDHGQWIDVPYIENTFVVNLGDALSMWTGKRFKATNHRVLNSHKARYSIPFFYEPGYRAIIEPLAVTGKQTPSHAFQYGSFLTKKIKQFGEYQTDAQNM